jgi:predicted dehydrogenase
MFAQGRREFLKTCTAFGSMLFLPGGVLAKGKASPNNRLNLAYIGMGGRSRALLRNQREGTNVVGLCDVDRNCKGMETVKEICPKAKFFTDYRKMLDVMEKEIDAVVIATPNHTHFPIAMHYARAKKHLYVEKPITTTIWEARQLARAQKKYGITTQMGNQGRSFEGPCLAREWYDAGMIGDFVEAHVWSGRSGAKSAIIPEPEPVPETLDWDLWIGPARMRAFSKSYLNWRRWWDFGGGPLFDIGCHTLEAPLFALDSLDVVRVEAKTSERWPENPPKSSVVEFHIKPKNGSKVVKIYWYDGGKVPDSLRHLESSRSAKTVSPGGGAYMVGTKAGMILPGMRANSARLAPEKIMREWVRNLPEKTVPRTPGGSGGHMQIWVDACKQGTKANSDFADYAVPLAEIVMLGVIAKRTGQPVEWDSGNMRITSSEQADALLRPHIRKGWEYRA